MVLRRPATIEQSRSIRKPIHRPIHKSLMSRPAEVARPLVEAWVGSVGLKCECADYVPPAKRPRGRPRQLVNGCRDCWRSLCTDRAFPSPHSVSLATRCLLAAQRAHPGLTRHAVTQALKHVLPQAGFVVDRFTAELPLPSGSKAPKAFGLAVFGWRDKRDDAVVVQRSTLLGAGGGLFAAVDLVPDTHLCKFEGQPVAAEAMRRKGYRRGYLMRVGPRYIDARDPSGRLRLANGALLDVHGFGEAEWVAFEGQRGVGWEGSANPSRFVNHAPEPNAKFCHGWLVTTQAVQAGDELFVRYGKDFWLLSDE